MGEFICSSLVISCSVSYRVLSSLPRDREGDASAITCQRTGCRRAVHLQGFAVVDRRLAGSGRPGGCRVLWSSWSESRPMQVDSETGGRRWAWRRFWLALCLTTLAGVSSLAAMDNLDLRLFDGLFALSALSALTAYMGRAIRNPTTGQAIRDGARLSWVIPVLASAVAVTSATVMSTLVEPNEAVAVQLAVMAMCILAGVVAGLLWRVWVECTSSESSVRKYLDEGDPLSRPKDKKKRK